MKLGITNFESRGVLKCDSKLFLEEGVKNRKQKIKIEGYFRKRVGSNFSILFSAN
jgi:hypothetical protein